MLGLGFEDDAIHETTIEDWFEMAIRDVGAGNNSGNDDARRV